VDFGLPPLTANGENAFFVKYPISGAPWNKNAGGLATGASAPVGSFYDHLTLGSLPPPPPQPSSEPLIILPAQGARAMLVMRYTPAGKIVWARAPHMTGGAGWAGSSIARSVACDSLGSALVAGDYAGTADFGNGIALTTYGQAANPLLVKYDPHGNVLWVRAGKCKLDAHGYGVALDAHDNVYLAGVFTGHIAFSSPGQSPVDLDAGGPHQRALFVAKYAPDGTPLEAIGTSAGKTSSGVGGNLAVGVAVSRTTPPVVVVTSSFAGHVNLGKLSLQSDPGGPMDVLVAALAT